RYRLAAEERVRAHAASALQHPFGHGSLLSVAAGLAEPPRQVVVVTADAGGALAGATRGINADVIAVVTTTRAQAFEDAGFELFAGKSATAEQVFDCRAFVCRLPVSDPAAVVRARSTF